MGYFISGALVAAIALIAYDVLFKQEVNIYFLGYTLMLCAIQFVLLTREK